MTNIGGVVSWSTLSDGRFKKEVREDVPGLEFVKRLRAVSYEVDRGLLKQFVGAKDDESETRGIRAVPTRETGFIAQEVEKLVQKSGYAFQGAVAPSNNHDMYSIRYSDFVVPLVKAVQQLTSIVEAQKTALEQQQLKIESLLEKYNAAEGVKQSTGALMLQNTPNPFTNVTQIKMIVSEGTTNAVLIIYNLEGKQIKQIPVTGRGDTSISIASSELAAGMYLYSLIVDGNLVDTKRMVISK